MLNKFFKISNNGKINLMKLVTLIISGFILLLFVLPVSIFYGGSAILANSITDNSLPKPNITNFKVTPKSNSQYSFELKIQVDNCRSGIAENVTLNGPIHFLSNTDKIIETSFEKGNNVRILEIHCYKGKNPAGEAQLQKSGFVYGNELMMSKEITAIKITTKDLAEPKIEIN